MHLQIDVAHVEGHTVLSPQGEIDFATGPALEEAVTDALVAGDVHLVIDLSGVDFIESIGLGALIGGRRRAQALNGSLSLVCANDQTLKVFAITGLDRVFTIHRTLRAATAEPVGVGEAAWPTPQTERP